MQQLLKILFLISFSFGAFGEDISFNFTAQPLELSPKVIVDEWIEIAPFEAPGKGVVKPPRFRLIMGYGSQSVFDALKVDEVAGLYKKDALEFIANLGRSGKTEKDGAFIAGLTNIYNGNHFFVFYNLERMAFSKPYAYRILSHEPLHMARLLITTIENPLIDYIKDPWTVLDDSNEEYFAEMLERVAAISMHRYFKKVVKE
jgi:hypothetical protein